MIFGDLQNFAVELLVDWPLLWGRQEPVQLSGRMRVWIHGCPVGDLDECACWMLRPIEELHRCVRSEESRWIEGLDALSPHEQFDYLDWIWYGNSPSGTWPRRGPVWSKDPDEVRDSHSDHTVLLHTSEAFDGWKVFLIRRPEATESRFLWRVDTERTHCHEVAQSVLLDVTEQAWTWLQEQDEEWRSP